jgi:hypothetical protein
MGERFTDNKHNIENSYKNNDIVKKNIDIMYRNIYNLYNQLGTEITNKYNNEQKGGHFLINSPNKWMFKRPPHGGLFPLGGPFLPFPLLQIDPRTLENILPGPPGLQRVKLRISPVNLSGFTRVPGQSNSSTTEKKKLVEVIKEETPGAPGAPGTLVQYKYSDSNIVPSAKKIYTNDAKNRYFVIEDGTTPPQVQLVTDSTVRFDPRTGEPELIPAPTSAPTSSSRQGAVVFGGPFGGGQEGGSNSSNHISPIVHNIFISIITELVDNGYEISKEKILEINKKIQAFHKREKCYDKIMKILLVKSNSLNNQFQEIDEKEIFSHIKSIIKFKNEYYKENIKCVMDIRNTFCHYICSVLRIQSKDTEESTKGDYDGNRAKGDYNNNNNKFTERLFDENNKFDENNINNKFEDNSRKDRFEKRLKQIYNNIFQV